MRFILSALLLFTLIISNQIEAFKVNEGASTSHAYQEHHVSDDEKCAIDNFVDGFFTVFIAGDLTYNAQDVTATNYRELLWFEDYFEKIVTFLRYGSNCKDEENAKLLNNYEARQSYFHYRAGIKLGEMMISGCSGDFTQRFQLAYNKFSASFTVTQTDSFASSQCTSYDKPGGSKQSYSRYTRTKNRTLKKSPKKAVCFKKPSNRPKKNRPAGLNLSRHNIIPLSLISKFFSIWFASSLYSGFGANECPVTRSLMFWLKKMNTDGPIDANSEFVLNYNLMSSNPYLNRVVQTLLSLSTDGNAYIGPSTELRGPLDPRMRGDYGFEFNSDVIIGQERFTEMLELYGQLVDYVESGHLLNDDYERSRIGSLIIISMMLKFMGHEVTVMNVDQWEFRELTSFELPADKKDSYRGKKFWAIKKKNKPTIRGRPRRSLYQEPVEQDDEECQMMQDFANIKWSEFVEYLMNVYLQSKGAKKSTSWTCDFVRLYFDFQFSSSSNDCLSSNFDTFLLSKISHTHDWRECINFNNNKPAEWCKTWRRFLLDSTWSNRTDQKQLSQDLETLVHWLWQKVSLETDDKLPDQVTVKNLVCPKTASQDCLDYCRNGMYRVSSERAKRNIPEENEIFILYQGNEGNLLCNCSENGGSSISNKDAARNENSASNSIIDYIKKFFRGPCTKSDYDTSRCEDLR